MSTIALYFDPGTGALIVQTIAAAGMAVVFFYKRIITSIKSLFGKKEQTDLMGDIDIQDNKDAGDTK